MALNPTRKVPWGAADKTHGKLNKTSTNIVKANFNTFIHPPVLNDVNSCRENTKYLIKGMVLLFVRQLDNFELPFYEIIITD